MEKKEKKQNRKLNLNFEHYVCVCRFQKIPFHELHHVHSPCSTHFTSHTTRHLTTIKRRHCIFNRKINFFSFLCSSSINYWHYHHDYAWCVTPKNRKINFEDLARKRSKNHEMRAMTTGNNFTCSFWILHESCERTSDLSASLPLALLSRSFQWCCLLQDRVIWKFHKVFSVETGFGARSFIDLCGIKR